ncbi:MAG TPA: hypothetical protein VEC17_03795 [Candidatus Binatia bacterium]|nr:hypothetical protein [Candidatus Binatia bacterium]
MIATSHLIIGGSVGVIVGSVSQNPLLALIAGVVSHFLCDSLPHWDHPDAPKLPNGDIVWIKKVWIFAFSDSIIGGLIALSIWGIQFNFDLLSPFIWGAAGGYLPDFIDNVPFWKERIRKLVVFQKFHDFHVWIHDNWRFKYPMPEYWILGTITQIILVVPALWYLLN